MALMSFEIDISEHHKGMLEALRSEHGGEIDEHIRERVEVEIHESFRQMQRES